MVVKLRFEHLHFNMSTCDVAIFVARISKSEFAFETLHWFKSAYDFYPCEYVVLMNAPHATKSSSHKERSAKLFRFVTSYTNKTAWATRGYEERIGRKVFAKIRGTERHCLS